MTFVEVTYIAQLYTHQTNVKDPEDYSHPTYRFRSTTRRKHARQLKWLWVHIVPKYAEDLVSQDVPAPVLCQSAYTQRVIQRNRFLRTQCLTTKAIKP